MARKQLGATASNAVDTITQGGVESLNSKTLIAPTLLVNDNAVTIFNVLDSTKTAQLLMPAAQTASTQRTHTLPSVDSTLIGRDTTDDMTGKRATLAAGSATVAPLKFTSGTNLTTAAAGAIEFDGSTFAGTIDTTSGRGLSPVDQMFRLTADAGSAIGATIADYFGTNSAFPYVGAGVYEIVWNLFYTKTTAGTVTYTITSTNAPVSLSAWYSQTPVGGIGTAGTAQTAAISKSTSATAVLPATGSLTTAVQHRADVHALYVANASAGNVRLRVTESAGTITPLRDSFYRVRRLPSGNVGTFVA